MNSNTVLVAEDDTDIRDMLILVLQQAGFSAVGAKDGNTAARIAVMARPVGIVTDVRMPALNGIELCQLVRRSPQLRDTALLMTSAHAHTHDIEAGLSAGADRYLPKPLSPRQLVHDLRQLIEQRGHTTDATPGN